ncbi:hypothetical protein M422DRAFT_160127 [Sphaerobolus stellatus SS14]|nr:hypothetical protein M422DRAFT_160127 [Sphaerobolus stellatus SS14]
MYQIIARDSQMRGEIKTKLAPIVASTFGFDLSGTQRAKLKNRELAAFLLTENRIIFKDFNARQGAYQSPILQQIINAMWFKEPEDEGFIHATYFKPMPLKTIALIFTVVCSPIYTFTYI